MRELKAEIKAIFLEALECKDADELMRFLEQACGSDTALRTRVNELLRAHRDAGAFLGGSAEAQGGPEAAADGQDASGGDAPDKPAIDFLTPSEKPGSVGRLGHYEVLEVLGHGGMGIVLRAFDEKLHRVVAIKVMAAQLAINATARKRFTREARAQAAVSHDHVVTIHAVEEAGLQPYFVMQFVAGLSLQQRLDQDGPLALPEILRIGMQTASALAAAHAQGLVHRDIKPANILLENGVERVKVTDFGLARAGSDASLTQSGVVAGTPQFMSPEQARGDPVDQRTDLFSLGSVLHAMCTGRAPFRANSAMAVLKRVCEETPTPIRDVNPEIPDWLVAIIAKLQAKDQTERFQSAAEVAALLGRRLAHVQQPSVGGQVSDLTVEHPAGWKPAPLRRRLAIAAAAAVLLLGGLSLTEATGVTNLRATVVRIFTPDGTLVVEVDEPGVKVKVSLKATEAAVAPLDNARADADWAAAEQTLQLGGRLYLVGSELWITQRSQLPQRPFRLHTIGLDSSKQVTDPGLGFLKGMSGLHTLELSRTQVSDAGLQHLKGLTGLRHLWLDSTRVSNAGLVHLKGLTNLSSLGLNYNDGLTDEGLVHLKGLTNLSSLTFSNRASVDAGLVHLKGLTSLSSLGLSGTATTDAGLAHLKGLTNLRALYLASTGISDAGLEHLKDLTNLQRLDLNGTRVSDAGLEYLKGLTGLEQLKLYQTRISELGVRRLQEALPKCTITFPGGPFLVLRRGDREEQAFATLAEAVRGATDGDTIEVRGDGPFQGPRQQMRIEKKALVIRAGPGFRPVLVPHPELEQADWTMLLALSGPLTLEGLEFRRAGTSKAGMNFVYVIRAPCRLLNCRFVVQGSGTSVGTQEASAVEIRNCEFFRGGPDFSIIHAGGAPLVMENCVLASPGTMGVNLQLWKPDQPRSVLRLRHNTFALGAPLRIYPKGKSADKPFFQVQAVGNLFDGGLCFDYGGLGAEKPQSPADAERLLKEIVAWEEQGNLWASSIPLLRLQDNYQAVRTARSWKSLADWDAFWGLNKTDSLQGRFLYQNGSPAARLARLASDYLTASDFRLATGSPGKGAAPDGRDIGADVDFVGPGPPYERWKKTAEYQQWLKDTGQQK